MACSREIIKKITQYVRFRVPRTNEKDSYYTEIGNNLIRISNHCTWMKVWDNMLKENPKWQGKTIISVVFEDNGNTFSEECLFSLGYRRRPIKIREYVYNSSSLSKQDINLIIKSLQNLTKSNNFIDLSKKGVPNNRISVCPDYNNIETSSDGTPSKGGYKGADFVPENKSYKNRNMNKNRIRLTESQLHRVIKESVKKILKEGLNKNSWTEEKILKFVERHGGEGFSLIGKFPFSQINKQKIDAAYADEDNYTDSDLCDLIIDLAIEQVNNGGLGESQCYKTKKTLKENLFKKRRIIKESKNCWRGCPNVLMIWHGEWSDPELYANGYVANYWDVENSLWYSFMEETGHYDAESGNKEVEDEFSAWLRSNESEVISTIMEFGEES